MTQCVQAALQVAATEADELRNHAAQLATQHAALMEELDEAGAGCDDAARLADELAVARVQAESAHEAVTLHNTLSVELDTCKHVIQSAEADVLRKQGSAAAAAARLRMGQPTTRKGEAVTATMEEQQLLLHAAQAALAAAASAVTDREKDVADAQCAVDEAAAATARAHAHLIDAAGRMHMMDGSIATTTAAAAAVAEAEAALCNAEEAAAFAAHHAADRQQQLMCHETDAAAALAQLTTPDINAVLAAYHGNLEARAPSPSSSLQQCSSATASTNAAIAVAAVKPLHSCFRFSSAACSSNSSDRDPLPAERLLPALSALAGPAVLNTLVVPTAQHAHTLLAVAEKIRTGDSSSHSYGFAGNQGSSLRIWPLDRLRCPPEGAAAAQAAAAAALGSGRVILPLQLLLPVTPEHAPALSRALGTHVIVLDDAIAAELVEHHGLACVTLAGSLSRRGSMLGGWAGARRAGAMRAWAAKLRADVANAAAESARQDAAVAVERLTSAEEARRCAARTVAAARTRMRLVQELEKCRSREDSAATLTLSEARSALTAAHQRLASSEDHLKRLEAAEAAAAVSHSAAIRTASQLLVEPEQGAAPSLSVDAQHAQEELLQAEDKAREI